MAPKLIDNPTKKRIAIKLSAARSREGLYVDAALFSAYSAALQVQGTQISFLEKKAKEGSEEFEIGEFFVDVVVDLIVGQAAGKLLHMGLESMLRPLLRSRQAYFILPQIPMQKKDFKVKTAPEVKIDTETLKKIRAQAHTKLKDHFAQLVNSEDYGAYKVIPEAVIGAVLEVGSDAARSGVNIKKPPKPAETSSTREGKTVVVQVVTSAQDTYAVQKAAVDKLYDELTATLQYTDIDVEKGKEWELFLDENGTQGPDADALKHYRELLLMYYELSMWAHSVDLDKVTAEREKHNPLSMGDHRARQYMRDPKNYEIKKQDGDQVSYEYADMRPMAYGNGYGGVQVEKTVSIAKERLDYWINRFPSSFEDLEGPTILEAFQKQYSKFEMDKKKKEEALKVMAYESVLKMFSGVDRELTRSYRALKDASALKK